MPMNINLSCDSCGFQTATAETPPAPCPKCGKPMSSARPMSTSMPTMIEDVTPPLSGHSRSSSSSRLAAGGLPRSIDGHEILSLLGYGGMGAVYLAYEPLLDRIVALKL